MEQQIKEDLLSNSGLDDISQGYLLQTVRWTKFIAIMGFIFTGIALLAILLSGFASGNSEGVAYGIGSALGSGLVGVIILGVYFYPIYCLYQFSRYMKSGLYYEDKLQVMQAFRHQRNLYRYMGILLIIMIGFYALLFMFGGLMAGMGAI